MSVVVSDSTSTSEHIVIFINPLFVSDSVNLSEAYNVVINSATNNFIPISFDSNNLQTSQIVVTDILHAGLPQKRAQNYSLSHANASFIPFVEYPTKPITLNGTLSAADIPTLDALVDTFDSYFLTKNGNLDIGWSTGTRRYIATATNMAITRPGNLAWATFNITFTTSSAFGRATNTTYLVSDTARTNASYQDVISFGGVAPFQLPTITITYTALSANATDTVNVGNDATGQQISVTRTWLNGDVLVIDSTLATSTPVTVNGLAVNFGGAFPAFVVGQGTLDYSDSFISRTFNIVASYTKYYL